MGLRTLFLGSRLAATGAGSPSHNRPDVATDRRGQERQSPELGTEPRRTACARIANRGVMREALGCVDVAENLPAIRRPAPTKRGLAGRIARTTHHADENIRWECGQHDGDFITLRATRSYPLKRVVARPELHSSVDAAANLPTHSLPAIS